MSTWRISNDEEEKKHSIGLCNNELMDISSDNTTLSFIDTWLIRVEILVSSINFTYLQLSSQTQASSLKICASHFIISITQYSRYGRKLSIHCGKWIYNVNFIREIARMHTVWPPKKFILLFISSQSITHNKQKKKRAWNTLSVTSIDSFTFI
jgi:hypothetical protein